MKRIIFLLQYRRIKRVVDNYELPLLKNAFSDKYFDREWYWRRYKRGIPILSSVEGKIKLIFAKRIRDSQRKYTPEFQERYHRYCCYLEGKKEIKKLEYEEQKRKNNRFRVGKISF